MEEYRLRFTGERFEELGFPLECLPELTTFQVLVVEASKEMFNDASRSESHSAPDLSELLELRLTAFEKGSVIPVLSLKPEPILPGMKTRLEEALSWLEDSVFEIQNRPQMISRHEQGFINQVRKLGATLGDSEAIEFGAASERTIRWTKADAERIAYAQSEAMSGEFRVTLLGSISMLDRRKKFKLKTLEHGFATGDFGTDALYENFRDVLSSANAYKAVWVDCSINRVGRAGSKLKVTEVFDSGVMGELGDPNIVLLDNIITESIFTEPVEFFPSPDATIGALEFISQLQINHIRMPVIFLDEAGGFNFDWSSESSVLSLLVENDGNFIAYFKNFETGAERTAGSISGPSFAMEFIRGIDSSDLLLEG